MNDFRPLQLKILEIVKYFDDYCKENSITYFLMGGSALGAIRHKGFIPWDDDFDVFMDAQNYNKFIRLSRLNFDKDRFHVQIQQSKEWPMFFSKIRMNNTTFIEEDSKDLRYFHQGIYIDIMCFHNASNCLLIRLLQYFSAKLLTINSIPKTGYKTNSFFKKTLFILTKPINIKFIEKILFRIVTSSKNKDTKYIAHWFGRARYKNCIYERSLFQNQLFVDFENLQLPVMEHYHKYLCVRYGDKYMNLPSEKEKMKYKSHAYIWDVDKNYKDYY